MGFISETLAENGVKSASASGAQAFMQREAHLPEDGAGESFKLTLWGEELWGVQEGEAASHERCSRTVSRLRSLPKGPECPRGTSNGQCA